MAQLTDGLGNVLTDGQGGALTDGSSVAIYDARIALFVAVEIDAYLPGTAPGTLEHGTTDTLRVSDQGYRTRATDPLGVLAYPPLLETAFEIDRRLSLDPAQASSRSDGAVRIVNLGAIFDAFTLGRNIDSRRIRVLVGQKTYDPARGVFVDPPYATLRPFFSGSCGSWLLADDVLEIPLKDTSYWTQRPVQSKAYSGAGKLQGGSALSGKTIPVTRGGTAAAPVLNVPLVQVDTVFNIWQWTDGPGSVVQVYEAGQVVFIYGGDVADLYAGSTAPGQYRTCNALGVLQLGSPTSAQITADVTGAFPAAGAVSNAVALAYQVLVEMVGLPPDFVDAGAFMAVDAAVPYVAGFWNDGTGTGQQLVQDLLTSAGVRLASTRAGQLRPYILRPLPAAVAVDRLLDMGSVVSVAPAALPSTLDPPPYRWRVGYNRNYTVQSSGLNGAVSDARKQLIAVDSQTSTWSDTDVSAVWLRPGDPSPLLTYLLNARHARWVAEDHGAMWAGNPDYYTVVVPIDIAAGLDIGSVVRLTWSLGVLAGGALGQIVGEQVRSYDATVTLEILVSRDKPRPGFLDLVGIAGAPAPPQVNIIGVAP